MTGFKFAIVRRSVALPQVLALVLSLGLGVRSSLCPPGMDMGMEMDMNMSMPAGGSSDMADDSAMGHEAGRHCGSAGSVDDDGRTTCPFALGGIGPCGTTVPAPGLAMVGPTPVFSEGFASVTEPSGHIDPSAQVNLPPPRV
jgi:hypothetical protein